MQVGTTFLPPPFPHLSHFAKSVGAAAAHQMATRFRKFLNTVDLVTLLKYCLVMHILLFVFLSLIGTGKSGNSRLFANLIVSSLILFNSFSSHFSFFPKDHQHATD